MTQLLARVQHKRYALSAPVELRRGGDEKAAGLLIELSQETARISQLEPGRYEPGEAVTLKTPCGRTINAYVHSTFGARANVRFSEALRLPELVELLDANRSQPAVA